MAFWMFYSFNSRVILLQYTVHIDDVLFEVFIEIYTCTMFTNRCLEITGVTCNTALTCLKCCHQAEGLAASAGDFKHVEAILMSYTPPPMGPRRQNAVLLLGR